MRSFILHLFVLMLLINLQITVVGAAEDPCFDGLSTIPSRVNYLKVYVSSDTVTSGNYVEAWIDSGGHECPSYSWSVSGDGFHFESISGPTAVMTTRESERVQIWADDNACGSAFITVSNGCSDEAETSVREPNNGSWVTISNEECVVPGMGEYLYTLGHNYVYQVTKGGQRQIQWTRYCGGGGIDFLENYPDYCYAYCPNPNVYQCFTCENCIDPEDIYKIPTYIFPCDFGECFSCYCVSFLEYQKYQCPTN